MKIGRTYPMAQTPNPYTHAYAYISPHPVGTKDHCARCEVANKYPGQYDSYGNPIPAVPAYPTGRNPSPPPQYQSFSPPGPTTYNVTACGGGGGWEYSYDLVPLNEDILAKEEAPDFIGPRGMFKVEKLGWDWRNDPDIEKGYYEPCEYNDANLIGSKTDLENGGHLPVIDLDLPAHLEPSTKPDHYHLYINKVVAWDKYVKLLEALHECGLINEGFKEMSIRRGQSYVRRPGVYKQRGEADS
jgi:hypothetical protein